MKQSTEFKESMDNFDRLFRAVIAVPKAAVKKVEAKDKARNQKKRDARKKATKR